MFYDTMNSEQLYELKKKKIKERNELESDIIDIQRAIDDKPSMLEKYMNYTEETK